MRTLQNCLFELKKKNIPVSFYLIGDVIQFSGTFTLTVACVI